MRSASSRTSGSSSNGPRPNGEPAPGTPYNSFAYLSSCVTREDYDRAVAELAAESDGGSSDLRTAAGIAVIGGAVVLGGAAVMVKRRRPGPHDDAAGARRDARERDIRARLDALSKQRAELDAQTERIRVKLNSGGWTVKDLNEILGILTTLVGLGVGFDTISDGLKLSKAARDVLSKRLGIASMYSTSSGLIGEQPLSDEQIGRGELDEAQVRQDLWRGLENIGFLQVSSQASSSSSSGSSQHWIARTRPTGCRPSRTPTTTSSRIASTT